MNQQLKNNIARLALRLTDAASRSRARQASRVVLEALERAVHQQMELQREQNRLTKATRRGWLQAARRMIVEGRLEAQPSLRS